MPYKKQNKKQTKKEKNKFEPEIKNFEDIVDFQSLNSGDCFLFESSIWMKSDGGGVNLKNGTYDEDKFYCGIMVVPVEITIKWRKINE